MGGPQQTDWEQQYQSAATEYKRNKAFTQAFLEDTPINNQHDYPSTPSTPSSTPPRPPTFNHVPKPFQTKPTTPSTDS